MYVYVLALLERCYRTTDRNDKEQATKLASRFARGSVAITSACLADAQRFRANHSTMHLAIFGKSEQWENTLQDSTSNRIRATATKGWQRQSHYTGISTFDRCAVFCERAVCEKSAIFASWTW